MVWKITWRIWQIFIRALESLKIGTLMGFFDPKLKIYELKIYRGFMCHDNEEWCKSWRGIDLTWQNWHEECDKFWSKHSKISKICTLMGSFWSKCIIFELKKYKGVTYLMALKNDAKFEGKLILTWHEEFVKLSLTVWKIAISF